MMRMILAKIITFSLRELWVVVGISRGLRERGKERESTGGEIREVEGGREEMQERLR